MVKGEETIMTEKEVIRKIDKGNIQGDYILKNTDADKKKIIFSSVVWYDPESDRYTFKSESDMNGNLVSGDIVSHKLIQDLLSISKWRMQHLEKQHHEEAENKFATDLNEENSNEEN